MKGKYTGEDIRLLYDTLLCTSKYQVLGLLLMVDIEKAFDSVASSFMEKYLNKYNFGHDIKRWISSFYVNINSCEWAMFRVVWCEKMYETRWSAVSLFIPYLCSNFVLSDNQNKNIHGIEIFDEKILLSQFGDNAKHSLMVKGNNFVYVYLSCNVWLHCRVFRLI